MVARRNRWVTECCLLLGLVAGAPVPAAETSPEAVLKERGLTRSGSLYLLNEAEAAVLEQIDAVQPYYARLKEVVRTRQAIAENDDAVQAGEHRMTELDANIGLHNDRIAGFGRKNSPFKQILIAERAALVEERAKLIPQLDNARRARPGPGQRQALRDELERRRTEFVDKARYATAGAQKLQEQYAELGRDRAVAGALKTLRDTTKSRRFALGPSPQFRSKYREFVNAVKGAKTADELMQDAMNERQRSKKTRAR